MKRINIRIIVIIALAIVFFTPAQNVLSATQTPDPETALQHEAAQRMRLQNQLFTAQGAASPVWPCHGEITSYYGWRIHPIYGDWRFHYGIDIGVDTGTPVVAPLSGVVGAVYWSDAVGNVVEINHGSGVATRFCHLLSVSVTTGQTVAQGQTVALSGSTGDLVTGPHLHFEVYDWNDPANYYGTVDPLIWLSTPISYVSQFITSGVFNEDTNSDAVLLNGYWNDESTLETKLSDGVTMAGGTAWESGPGNFDSKRAKPTSGYFAGDGKSDIAALYNYGNANTGAIVFTCGDGVFTPGLFWSSGPGNFDWSRAKITSGDFDRNGFTDILALYDYGNANTAVIVFKNSGTAFAPEVVWSSGPGNFDWNRAMISAGDYNADSRADIVAVYDYGGANTAAILFESNGTGYAPRIAWSSGPGNMDWSRMKIAGGNFNGDSFDDVVAFYDYGGASTAAIVMQYIGAGFTNRIAWSSGPGNWDWARTDLTVCDFNGDTYADVVAVYDYGWGSNAGVVFKPNGPYLEPHVAWLETL